MMDYIWIIMMIIALLCGIFSGNSSLVADSISKGSMSAVNLIISTGGVICFWSGIMEIAENASITDFISKLLRPVLSRLFKNLKSDSKALKYITMNVSANLLGLGNAATPLGLSAMKELRKQHNSLYASDNMVLFVVLNTASIQLLPTTLCAYRSSYQSSAPFEILPAVWITSIASVTAGLLVAKCLMGVTRRQL